MERLHTENDLENFLLKQCGRSVTIFSAFASGTVGGSEIDCRQK